MHPRDCNGNQLDYRFDDAYGSGQDGDAYGDDAHEEDWYEDIEDEYEWT